MRHLCSFARRLAVYIDVDGKKEFDRDIDCLELFSAADNCGINTSPAHTWHGSDYIRSLSTRHADLRYGVYVVAGMCFDLDSLVSLTAVSGNRAISDLDVVQVRATHSSTSFFHGAS